MDNLDTAQLREHLTNDISTIADSTHPAWLENFIDVYQKLNVNNLSLINHIYHPHVTFKDPMHSIEGLPQLKAYFDSIYTNLTSCQFIIDDVILSNDIAAVYWRMTFVHKQLNKAEPITVEGHTKLIGEQDKVVYHRDYLDVGAMLYEHIPLIGRIIRYIKARVKS